MKVSEVIALLQITDNFFKTRNEALAHRKELLIKNAEILKARVVNNIREISKIDSELNSSDCYTIKRV